MLSSIISHIPLSVSEQKTLLTPASVNPGLLKRSLALKTGQLANLGIQSFSSFVVERSLPYLPGKTYLAGERKFWLMLGLLKKLQPGLHYFHESVHFHGICTLIAETIEELSLNGISADHLHALPNKKKWRDIGLIASEYASAKEQAALFDYADAVTVLLRQELLVPRTYLIKHHLTALEAGVVERSGILVIDPVTPETAIYTLSAFKVDTPYQEALQIIRNVTEDLQGARPPVRIGICVWDYAAAFQHIKPVVESMGLEDVIHFGKGEPVFSTPAGNLWKYFTEWVEGSFTVRRLLRVLEAPGFSHGDEPSSSFYQAIRCFRNAELPLFNAGFLEAFREYLDGYTVPDSGEDEEPEELAAASLAWQLAGRFAPVATADTVQEQIQTLAEVFESSVRIRHESDAGAVTRILSTLDEAIAASGSEDFAISLVDVLAVVNDSLDRQYVNATLPDGTRPVLATPHELLYTECDTLYILGLNEKGPPGIIYENPILLDQEKALLLGFHAGARLQVREDILREKEHWFNLLKQTATRRLILSAPLKDLSTGREMLVSRYLLNEWNRYHNVRNDYRAIAGALAQDPRSLNNHIPLQLEATFYPYELAVAAHVHHLDDEKRNGLLEKEFPFAHTGRAFRQARQQAQEFDQYWGVVSPPADRALPVFSATMLARWTRCPYQYFLRHELRLDRELEFDTQELEWLDHLAYGSFLHDLFFRFFLRLRKKKGEGFRSVDQKDGEVLWDEFHLLLKEYARRHPVVSLVHHEQTVQRLKRDVEGFLHHEMVNNSQRLFAELSFGMPGGDEEDYLLRKEEPGNVPLQDGTSILVRGRIDRVDRTTEGRPVLVDYKTGRLRPVDPERPFEGGELMQAGLYSEVAGQIDKDFKDALFRYYYVTRKSGFGEHVVDYAVQRKHFLRFLTAVVGEIRRGNFVPAATDAGKAPCSFCDFADVCVDGRRLLAERLQGSTELGRYHELVETEGSV